jgi:hypothetical protein
MTLPPLDRTTATQGGAGRQPTKNDAKTLRDAAFQAHVRVAGAPADDSKEALDVTPGMESRFLQVLANWGHFDASRMVPIPQKGSPNLCMVRYEYHSGKPMEAWLDAKPKDGKLKLKAAICVSGHDGLPHDQFANSNIYEGEIRSPQGTCQRIPLFGPGVSKKPEHASLSAEFEIDVSRPGDYTIDFYPIGSCKVFGYVEMRRLILHVTGNET